jgi:hypothetical protein
MTSLEARITPSGATPVFQLEEGKPAALFNAQPVKVLHCQPATEAQTFPRNIRLGLIPDARVRVVRPIPVELSRSDESVIAVVQDQEEFGQGATSSDAVTDLGFSLAELFLSLQQEEPRLGPDLAELLGKLRTYLVLVR